MVEGLWKLTFLDFRYAAVLLMTGVLLLTAVLWTVAVDCGLLEITVPMQLSAMDYYSKSWCM